jgi:hypothetical protein
MQVSLPARGLFMLGGVHAAEGLGWVAWEPVSVL